MVMVLAPLKRPPARVVKDGGQPERDEGDGESAAPAPREAANEAGKG